MNPYIILVVGLLVGAGGGMFVIASLRMLPDDDAELRIAVRLLLAACKGYSSDRLDAARAMIQSVAPELLA